VTGLRPYCAFVLLPVVGVELTDTPGEAVLLKAMGPGSLCSCRPKVAWGSKNQRGPGLRGGRDSCCTVCCGTCRLPCPLEWGRACLTTGMVTGRVLSTFLSSPTVVHADASVGPGRAKVEVHPSAPSEPVCPAGEVLLLPAEAGAACSSEPCALPGVLLLFQGGCGVVGATL
jgi:hypothetical protein